MTVILSDCCCCCRLHDYDNNDRLDGLEVMAAIAHVVPTDPDLDLAKPGEEYVLTEEQKQKLIVARAAHEEQHKHFISIIQSISQLRYD